MAYSGKVSKAILIFKQRTCFSVHSCGTKKSLTQLEKEPPDNVLILASSSPSYVNEDRQQGQGKEDRPGGHDNAWRRKKKRPRCLGIVVCLLIMLWVSSPTFPQFRSGPLISNINSGMVRRIFAIRAVRSNLSGDVDLASNQRLMFASSNGKARLKTLKILKMVAFWKTLTDSPLINITNWGRTSELFFIMVSGCITWIVQHRTSDSLRMSPRFMSSQKVTGRSKFLFFGNVVADFKGGRSRFHAIFVYGFCLPRHIHSPDLKDHQDLNDSSTEQHLRQAENAFVWVPDH